MQSVMAMEDIQVTLPELISQLAPGDEIILTRDRRTVAKLVGEGPGERKLGTLKGTVRYVAPDFDAPLDDFQEYMQ